jgi:hypothetical protein
MVDPITLTIIKDQIADFVRKIIPDTDVEAELTLKIKITAHKQTTPIVTEP